VAETLSDVPAKDPDQSSARNAATAPKRTSTIDPKALLALLAGALVLAGIVGRLTFGHAGLSRSSQTQRSSPNGGHAAAAHAQRIDPAGSRPRVTVRSTSVFSQEDRCAKDRSCGGSRDEMRKYMDRDEVILAASTPCDATATIRVPSTIRPSTIISGTAREKSRCVASFSLLQFITDHQAESHPAVVSGSGIYWKCLPPEAETCGPSFGA
jgi:hypothetical protein